MNYNEKAGLVMFVGGLAVILRYSPEQYTQFVFSDWIAFGLFIGGMVLFLFAGGERSQD